MADNHPVLVVGATGHQGGSPVRALLRDGADVRALVRDPQVDKAQELASLGATLVKGDLEDVVSLEAAASDVRAVFSVQSLE